MSLQDLAIEVRCWAEEESRKGTPNLCVRTAAVLFAVRREAGYNILLAATDMPDNSLHCFVIEDDYGKMTLADVTAQQYGLEYSEVEVRPYEAPGRVPWKMDFTCRSIEEFSEFLKHFQVPVTLADIKQSIASFCEFRKS